MDSSDEDDIDLAQLDHEVEAKKQSALIESPPTSPLKTSQNITTTTTTHHKLDFEETKTWVYPTNLPIRDYQYNIVQQALFKNVLCALPTGMGKTFIASTVMLNWYRWTSTAKIVFMAPTRPLVSQQVGACLGITGIPRHEVSVMIGGSISAKLRENEWKEKRVFFATPQTIENDLKKGVVDPKEIVCLVVDEAHRGTGNYAYSEVVQIITNVNPYVRILSLTATPSNSIEGVQKILTNMKVSKAEIRTEESIDVQPYVHKRDIIKVPTKPLDIQTEILDLFGAAVDPLLKDMVKKKVLYTTDSRNLVPYAVVASFSDFQRSPAGRDFRNPMNMVIRSVMKILIKVAGAIQLLKIHGIRTFYEKVVAIKNAALTDKDGKKKKKPGKYMMQLLDDENFKKSLEKCQSVMFKNDGQPDLKFLGSEKLQKLVEEMNKFYESVGSERSRAIVFVEYRGSAAEVCRVMQNNCNNSMVKPALFVGQAGESKSSSKKKDEDNNEEDYIPIFDQAGEVAKRGMTQKEQQRVVQEFKDGKYNVLVATSIGEEGLDIGQVDLIVCYDQSKSPIRGLQRMGRTGRKRAGKIIMLFAENEQRKLEQAMHQYKSIQHEITNAAGRSDTFEYEPMVRILPDDVKPVVDKKCIEIPVENEQVLGENVAEKVEKLQKEQKKKKNTPNKKPPSKTKTPQRAVKEEYAQRKRQFNGGDEEDEMDWLLQSSEEEELSSQPPVRKKLTVLVDDD